jgi:class 3 adenylate cyclase
MFGKHIERISRLSNSFYMVVVLIQLLLITLTTIFTYQTIIMLDENEQEKVKGIVEFVGNQLEQATSRALIGISAIANNNEIKRSFAAHERDKLLTIRNAIWKELKPLGFAQFQYHLPINNNTDVISFLRVHEPAKFNDSLAAIRPTVVKANVTRQLVKGLEQGRYGYSFRAVAPVSLDKVYVGTVELGFDFGDAFLEILNTHYAGSWGVYNLSRGVKALDDRIVINSIGPHTQEYFKNILPDEAILEKARRGEYYFASDDKSRTNSLYIPVSNFQGDNVLLVKYVYPSPHYEQIKSIIITSVVICLLGLILSSLIIMVLYRMITTPIRGLVAETNRIKNFQLDDDIDIKSSLVEVRELIEAMKGMKKGLQSFSKYVPAQLVRQLIETKQEAMISGQRKNITVFFSDVMNFTTISEELTPNELAAQLSEYLSEMTTIIMNYHGTVDKYIGDAIMAFWGAPIDMDNSAELACRAAIDCQKRAKELAVKWLADGKKPFFTRIGINSGEIVVGNIGSEQRFNYTVIGDAVNLASRLEGINKVYGTSIIISQNTVNLLPDDFAMRMLDYVLVKGKLEPVGIYELVAEKGDVTERDLDFIKYFNHCFDLYRARQWDEAIRRLNKLIERRPDDLMTRMYIGRCEEYKKSPPPDDWTGVYQVAK